MIDILSTCTSGGCGAKIGPGELGKLLDSLPPPRDDNLLVGYGARDDAAVYRLTPDTGIVSTLDFFPPMVSDPFLFGKIAAANALSDIYAMGGTPLFALSLVCFPEAADKAALAEILRGGTHILAEAGIPLAGGHSIHDREIKFGLSVTGRVHPEKILRNNGCRPGDRLLLTKPLGTGIILAAHRVALAAEEHCRAAVAVMERLNRDAAEAARGFSPTACTDVTGFGLLVHLGEMAGESVTVELCPDAVPVLPGAREYAEEYLVTAAGQRNRHFMESRLDAAAFARLPGATQELLLDPQTSGGLLFSVPEAEADALLEALRRVEPAAALIGTVTERKDGPIAFCETVHERARS